MFGFYESFVSVVFATSPFLGLFFDVDVVKLRKNYKSAEMPVFGLVGVVGAFFLFFGGKMRKVREKSKFAPLTPPCYSCGVA